MVYIAAMTGYDFVSPRPIYIGLPNEPRYPLAENRVMLQQTKTALKETGVKVWDIELARICDGVSPKTYLPALEVAAELGGHSVLCSIWAPDKKYQAESFAELCALAKPFDLTVDLEFVPWSCVTNLREALDIIRTAKSDNVGIMIDTLHFSRARVGLEELEAVPRELFHYMHLCDGPGEIPSGMEEMIQTGRQERLYPGEGGIDLAAIIRRLPDVIYCMELPNTNKTQVLGYAEHARRCLQAAVKYFAENGINT